MAAILLDIQPGDEVIVPSYTFVSTANAFVLRGAKIVFIDSMPDHPNMDVNLLDQLISPKTKAIVPVHYGGLPCEMDRIMEIANRHGIMVVEDAAQGIDSFYHGKALGGIGHLGTYSFHETKNIQSGEGGMLIINEPSLVQRAEIIWEKGTNRAAFFRGEIDKYAWVDLGSSFLPSEVAAAFLWAQLENLDQIQERRKAIWEDYICLFGNQSLRVLGQEYGSIVRNLKFKMENGEEANILNSSILHSKMMGNAHLFYLLFPDLKSRTEYAKNLRKEGILAVYHYQSLHRSSYAQKHFPDQYHRELPNADRFSDCLLRLPLFYELPELSKEVFG
jgi:dTDP-4-amino-4,6-dideoxygalactose transaminase